VTGWEVEGLFSVCLRLQEEERKKERNKNAGNNMSSLPSLIVEVSLVQNKAAPAPSSLISSEDNIVKHLQLIGVYPKYIP
jgi:hypothetical protein